MGTILYIHYAANVASINGADVQLAPSEYIVVTESGERLVKGSAETVTAFLESQGYHAHANILNCWTKA